MDTLALIWIAFGALLIALEFLLPGAVLGFLGGSALLTGLLIHLGHVSGLIPITMTFIISSILFLVVLRSALLKFFPDDSTVQNTDETADAIGTVVVVIEDITATQRGRIKYLDVSWVAQSDVDIKKDEKAIITGRDGQCWFVKPAQTDVTHP